MCIRCVGSRQGEQLFQFVSGKLPRHVFIVNHATAQGFLMSLALQYLLFNSSSLNGGKVGGEGERWWWEVKVGGEGGRWGWDVKMGCENGRWGGRWRWEVRMGLFPVSSLQFLESTILMEMVWGGSCMKCGEDVDGEGTKVNWMCR